MNGVPPAGALEMMRTDPELRGRDLFDRHCASCHVLGRSRRPREGHGDEASTAGGRRAWIAAMIHDPDAPQFFGRGPYKGADAERRRAPEGQARERAVDRDGQDATPRSRRSRSSSRRSATSRATRRGPATPRSARSARRSSASGARAATSTRATATTRAPASRRSSRATARSRGRAPRWRTRRRRRRTARRRSTRR